MRRRVPATDKCLPRCMMARCVRMNATSLQAHHPFSKRVWSSGKWTKHDELSPYIVPINHSVHPLILRDL